MSLSSVLRSFVVVLSAVSYATAQIPLGVQMIPNPEMSGYSDPAPSYPGYSGSSSYSVPPAETGSPSYGAPPSQYTPPPAEPPSSYEPMPYSSFTGGGYSQMDCGYGYKKGYDGKCTPESWVCPIPSLFPNTRLENKPTGCCGVFADRPCAFFLVGRQQQLGLLSDHDHH